MKSAFNILVLSILLIGCKSENANSNLSLQTEIDTTQGTIGDIIHYRIRMNGNKMVKLDNIQLADGMEIRNQTINDDEIGFEFVFWDTGRFTLPGIDVIFLNPDSSEKITLTTDPTEIMILSAADSDLLGLIKPMKNPVPVSRPWPLKIIFMILVILVSIIAMVWLSIRYKKIKMMGLDDTVLPRADIIALEKLNALHERLKSGLNAKEFYVNISYILREYVENSLFVKTLEMTTEEIRINKNILPYPENEISFWLNILERADLIKYAKMIPQQSACLDDLYLARNFVESTTNFWKQFDLSLA